LGLLGGCVEPVEMPLPDASAPDLSEELPAGARRVPDGVIRACPDGRDLEVAMVQDGVARLRRSPERTRRPSYAVVPQGAPPAWTASARGELLVVRAPAITLEVAADCSVRAREPDGTVIAEESRDLVLASPAGERLLALGLHTGASLDLRGRILELYNTDAYDGAHGGFRPDAMPLYESIPLLVGLRGTVAHALFVDSTYRLRFDLAATHPERITVTAPAGDLDHYFIAGPTLADVSRRYTALTGRPALPPRWALGFLHSRWENCGADPSRPLCTAAGAEALVDEFRARRLPLDGLFLDIQHMRGFRSFTFDAGRFPDPQGLFARLAARGVHTTLILDPGIKVDPAWDVYAEGLAGGHFLGAPFVGQVWPGDSVFPDFSSEETRTWWSGLVGRSAALGVRGLWIDMNEPATFNGTVPDSLACDGDGRPTTMAELHNVYALDEARATWDGLRAARPDERPFILSRAAFAGQQRYTAVWTGDAPSTFTTLRMTLPMLVSLGLSGMTFAGSDVGGYSGRAESTGELYARWLALGTLSPLLREHAEQNARRQEPWAFGEEVESAARQLVAERYALLPYLYSLFAEAHESGAPILRPLAWDFPEETASDQALLGPFLLYAPILEKGAAARAVRLPPGRWMEAASGAILEGGATVTLSSAPEPLPLHALPAFLREGAIVPRAEPMQHTNERPLAPLHLDVWPGPKESRFTLYEDDGFTWQGPSSRVAFTARRTTTGAELSAGPRTGAFAPPARRVIVRLRRVDHAPTAVRLGGAPAAGWSWDAEDRSLTVPLDDAPPWSLAVDYDTRTDGHAPPVRVPVRVRLPAGTPAGATIHVASSAGGWTHQPLTRNGDQAEGFILVERGRYLFYKITRGDWSTVEKKAGCLERDNRATLASAGPVREIEVAAWADLCQ
jgi:alpha-glucosidase